jgi:KaiC/GvpD/RAD55 family RecA-like ATPase
MDDAGDSLPIDEFPSGSILVSGPAMSGKYELLLDFVIEGGRLGEGGLFVTTNEPAESVRSDVQSRGGAVPEFLGIVDCVSERQSTTERLSGDHVEYVTSPGDMTSIGIGVSEQLGRFEDAGIDRTRLAFHSLSTLLLYSDVETVFRFLHVLTGRIDAVDAVALFTIDSTAHDDETMTTLGPLFDGTIEHRRGEDGTEIRFAGLPETPDGWVGYG